MASLTVLFLACLACAVDGIPSSPKEVRHELTLTYTDGSNSVFDDDEASLRATSVASYCHQGVWILYYSEDYAETNRILYSVDQMCDSFPSSRLVRSARTVGIQTDNSIPSINLYSDTNLAGDSDSFMLGATNITIRISSMVTISTPRVEFFREVQYGGDSICYNAADLGSCTGETCWIWILYTSDMPWDIRTARSANRGCSPDAKVYIPKNHSRYSGQDAPQLP